jgi:hypothetical protein
MKSTKYDHREYIVSQSVMPTTMVIFKLPPPREASSRTSLAWPVHHTYNLSTSTFGQLQQSCHNPQHHSRQDVLHIWQPHLQYLSPVLVCKGPSSPNILPVSVLLVNAIAILSEDRFLARGTPLSTSQNLFSITNRST